MPYTFKKYLLAMLILCTSMWMACTIINPPILITVVIGLLIGWFGTPWLAERI